MHAPRLAASAAPRTCHAPAGHLEVARPVVGPADEDALRRAERQTWNSLIASSTDCRRASC
eukprot:13392011-Alexandrium_andersonii.AAC.1